MKKLFNMLNAEYYFSPIYVTTDFSFPQIKALRDYHSFKNNINCIFLFSQIILKKIKRIQKIKQKMIWNFEKFRILYFIDTKNIKEFFNSIKNKFNDNDAEKNLMNYV